MINEIAQTIRTRLDGRCPNTALILGSGLNALADEISNPVIIPYAEIEGFPRSTVAGHQGRLICGKLAGREVLCLQGRFHLYEGHAPQTINTVIKVLQTLSIKELIVTNAAGSLNPDFAPGSLMLIADHINLSGTNPLIGPDDEKYGPRFPGMANAYTAAIRQQVKQLAARENILLHEGIYMMVLGPNFETAAEIKAYRILGADAVGMSTVPEVIAAVHSGMKVLGISVITNYGTGMSDIRPSHEETLREGEKAAANLTRLLKAYLKEN